jgi:glycosyltransferase involved in cell wall biosynthesis
MNSGDRVSESRAPGSEHKLADRQLRIALYETSVQGHRGPYLVAIAAEAIRRRWAVTIVTPAKDRTHPYFSRLGELLGPSNLVFTPFWTEWPKSMSGPILLRYHFDQWQAARRSLSGNDRPWDFVYAPSIDYMDKAIQILGAPSYPVPMGGMAMRVRFHLKQLGVATHRSLLPSLGSLAFSHLLQVRGLCSVTTADPSLAKYCQGKKASRYRKVFYVPELGMEPPARDCASAKKHFGFEPQDKVILVFGFIDVRKAIKELAAAVGCANPSQRIRILIVGSPGEATRALLASGKCVDLQRTGILVARLGFADDETQTLAFAAADVVWIAYRNHSTMSGVFSQAMSCSLPVIGPDYGLLSWLVSHYKVGISVNIDNPSETGSRIEAMLQNTQGMRAFRASAALLAHSHLPQSFGGAVCDAIAAGCANQPVSSAPTARNA